MTEQSHIKDTTVVWATVVTYNRLELLKECVAALRSQTRTPDKIFIVNNSSTDGTAEWLEAQKDLSFVTQPNSGSAGGQYTSLKTAYEAGADWVWAMDDDGLPASTALANLLPHSTHGDVLNSLVVDKSDHHKLVFGLFSKSHGLFVKTTAAARESAVDGRLDGVANPFNGTLLHRKVLEVAGYPDVRTFIWGDELEYLDRLNSHGLRLTTIIDAIHLHPASKVKWVAVKLLGKTTYIPALDMSSTRDYYFVRNNFYRYRYYHPAHKSATELLKATLYYIKAFQLLSLMKYFKFAWTGYFKLKPLPDYHHQELETSL